MPRYGCNCFNSLQAGRGIQRTKKGGHHDPSPSFNSLQAGRGIQSFTGLRRCVGTGAKSSVSIPFKREGAFKVSDYINQSTALHLTPRKVSIPFKREGAFKGKGSEHEKSALDGTLPKFQFPSSGKGHSKKIESGYRKEHHEMLMRFNSLQAGRGIQR